ncbi:molybdopterin-guanine dinucleotide biosynthesis protein B [Paenibacillus sp. BR2-3]|uniref:molybdopterin-guanine dinucleotide biosynthesis protein B n=1 Tax=Paenibacillus sp. BR2-3 TaxID=3048494 RepID=UPI003977B2B3
MRSSIQSNSSRKSAVCQFVGYKNSGKTSLICALIPLLREKGHTVAVIKHSHHDIEINHPQTDTWRQSEAGATAVAITNGTRTARIEEQGIGLPELVKSFEGYDYILVEGFKAEHYPKMVLIRNEEDLALLSLTAVSSAAYWEQMKDSVALHKPKGMPQFNINDVTGIANYLLLLT